MKVPKSSTVEIRDIKILYCPTDLILVDFFTKPLQCRVSTKFRKVIMGHTSNSDILDQNSKLEECDEDLKM